MKAAIGLLLLPVFFAVAAFEDGARWLRRQIEKVYER